MTPEVEEKVLNRIKPRDISKDVEMLKHYLPSYQTNRGFDDFDFLEEEQYENQI